MLLLMQSLRDTHTVDQPTHHHSVQKHLFISTLQALSPVARLAGTWRQLGAEGGALTRGAAPPTALAKHWQRPPGRLTVSGWVQCPEQVAGEVVRYGWR
jgi:hypothetical protein